MSRPHIHTYQEINAIIRRTFPDIPSQVDPEGFILADGVSLAKNVYDPANGKYELHVRDTKNNKWKSFDSEDNPDFVEDAARCFAEFYSAKQDKAGQQAKPTDGDNRLNRFNCRFDGIAYPHFGTMKECVDYLTSPEGLGVCRDRDIKPVETQEKETK